MLQIKGLTKIFKSGKGDKRAVDNLSLNVAPGDIYGFIGHNGAGKTTTLRACAGVMTYDSGEIAVNGIDVARDPIEAKRQLAYVQDNPELYDNLKAEYYLKFIGDIYGVPAAERRSRIEKYAGGFEIIGNLGDPIGSYSHGMKQKLALVAALLHAPRLLMLDEPFVGLDPKAALTLKGFMSELCQSGGAIFFSTHVLDVAEKLCNRVAIIKSGSLIAEGTMEEVRGTASLEAVFMELTETGGAANV
ncbi:MAG: ABC transporter ATP-binding protein [Oscillospiraceae bacterium]|jgi:ABC-2 type transport system ATP-binding protein|nr:ABC transporter ATP-binding protein [Oscillospiraceae bacterium]